MLYGYEGINIKWDGHDGVYIRLPLSLRNSTCGLCGNYNGIVEDDLRMPDGRVTTSIANFGNSWGRPDVNQICRNIQEQEVQLPCAKKSEKEMNKIRGMCQTLNDYPFTLCHQFINPKHFIQMCEQDACLCNITSDPNCICESITQYERACANEGLAVMWRKKGLCGKYIL